MAKELDVESILREYPSRFESKPFHSEEGDCIFYYFEDVDYDYERIDCWLSVYYARDDHRLVGFKLKNINALLSAFDHLGLRATVMPRGGWEIELKAALAFTPLVGPTTIDRDPYLDLLPRIRDQELVTLSSLMS